MQGPAPRHRQGAIRTVLSHAIARPCGNRARWDHHRLGMGTCPVIAVLFCSCGDVAGCSCTLHSCLGQGLRHVPWLYRSAHHHQGGTLQSSAVQQHGHISSGHPACAAEHAGKGPPARAPAVRHCSAPETCCHTAAAAAGRRAVRRRWGQPQAATARRQSPCAHAPSQGEHSQGQQGCPVA